ncbi:tyrosine-type recombinase/integrase [Streptomyces sp. NPDC056257]|uniref:tyrosine-type recombinase/integrase n=1 Tax=Streptomyces sp. NPDC056257 TaxID=3345765 RepID=UPI0035E2B587
MRRQRRLKGQQPRLHNAGGRADRSREPQAEAHRIRFLDLRHSTATLIPEQGVERVAIKELLGHAHVDVTATVYAHVRLRLRLEINYCYRRPATPERPHRNQTRRDLSNFTSIAHPSAIFQTPNTSTKRKIKPVEARQ